MVFLTARGWQEWVADNNSPSCKSIVMGREPTALIVSTNLRLASNCLNVIEKSFFFFSFYF